MLRIVQRRVPEGAEAVAGQPVDGAAMYQRLLDQGGQRLAHKPGKGSCVVAMAGGQLGQPAHAAHKIGDGARFAVRRQQRGAAGDLVDGGAGQGIGESEPQARAGHAQLIGESQGSGGEGQYQRDPGRGHIDQQPAAGKGKPGAIEQDRQRHQDRSRRPADALFEQQEHQRSAQQHQQQRLGQMDPGRPRRHGAEQHRMQRIGGDAGRGVRPQRRPDGRAAGPDDNDGARDIAGRICGDVFYPAPAQPQRSVRLGGQADAVRLHRRDGDPAQEGKRIALVRGDGDGGPLPDHAQRLGRQRGYQHRAPMECQGHAAHDAIAVGHQIGGAFSPRLRSQHFGRAGARGKARHPGKGVAAAAIDEFGLDGRGVARPLT